MKLFHTARSILQINKNKIQFQVFCDVSQKPYAALSYMRSLSSNYEIHVRNAIANTTVEHLKALNNPRLDLYSGLL